MRRLQGEIARKRDRLAASLSGLQREVAGLADWRQWYRRHPLPCLGVALVAGWTFGRLLVTPPRWPS